MLKRCEVCGVFFHGRKVRVVCSRACALMRGRAVMATLHPLEQRPCQHCQVPFVVGGRKGGERDAKFCSPICQHAYFRKHPPQFDHEQRSCLACQKVFTVGGKHGKKSSAIFCSRRCHQKSRYRCGTECHLLSEREASYLAGFFDGEGSVIMHGRANGSVGMGIDVSGTVLAPIAWAAETTGVGFVSCRKPRSERHKQCHFWRAGGDAAESVLRQVVHLLLVKRRQAELAIAFQERLRDPALKADRSWQVEWMARMKAMNARGGRKPEPS